MPKRPTFDDAQDRFITENYGSSLVRDIARELGRTEKSVQHRAHKLGLRKVVIRRWTPEEDQAIRAGIGERLADVAGRLGRRESEVSTRAKKLGLVFRKPSRPVYAVKDGYRQTRWMEDGRRRVRWEHIEVVERHMGRSLSRGELVHHINADKLDNRVENLWLCPNRTAHLRAHRSAEYVLKPLIERGIVDFDRAEGVYRICETDR